MAIATTANTAPQKAAAVAILPCCRQHTHPQIGLGAVGVVRTDSRVEGLEKSSLTKLRRPTLVRVESKRAITVLSISIDSCLSSLSGICSM